MNSYPNPVPFSTPVPVCRVDCHTVSCFRIRRSSDKDPFAIELSLNVWANCRDLSQHCVPKKWLRRLTYSFGRKRHPDSETVELDGAYFDIVTIYERGYQKHSIDHCVYFGPVDEDEADRLELQHRVFHEVFDSLLILPPIPCPQRVLDCGFGTGSWAVEVAEEYPDCEVIGVDISPLMRPEYTPQNLWLQVDDLNRPFTFPSNHFDLVHSRLLSIGIDRDRWPSYVRDIVRVLKPGGWVQMAEIYFNVQSDNGSITEHHALRRWSISFLGAFGEARDLRVGGQLRHLLTAAGLVEVDIKVLPLPLSAWSSDPKLRNIGLLNRDNIQQLFLALGLYPFTQNLHMGRCEFEMLVARAQQEADNLSLKAYFPLYVGIGRKP